MVRQTLVKADLDRRGPWLNFIGGGPWLNSNKIGNNVETIDTF